MSTHLRSPLKSSRFINMCVSNWFLHIYVYSLIPLLYAQAKQFGCGAGLVGWAIVAFAIGMILPGPFGAHLMECRSRKEVFLKSLLVLGFLPTLGYVWANEGYQLVLLHALQGVAFGVAQTALGTTLVNDVLASKQRNKGDVIYAWVGRLGIPLGPVVGMLLTYFFGLQQAYWWSLTACFMAFLLVGQTQIPLKAPVKVPLLTFDRFFIPKTLPLSLTLFIAPWMIGRALGLQLSLWFYLVVFAGFLFLFIARWLAHVFSSSQWVPALGYLLLFSAIVVYCFSDTLITAFMVGLGASLIASAHLKVWVTSADHCQRGTAQNTYMLSWRIAFSLGFLYSVYAPSHAYVLDLTILLICALAYYLNPSRYAVKSE